MDIGDKPDDIPTLDQMDEAQGMRFKSMMEEYLDGKEEDNEEDFSDLSRYVEKHKYDASFGGVTSAEKLSILTAKCKAILGSTNVVQAAVPLMNMTQFNSNKKIDHLINVTKYSISRQETRQTNAYMKSISHEEDTNK